MSFDPSPPDRLALGTLAGGVSAEPRRYESPAARRNQGDTQPVSRLAGPGMRWLHAELERRAVRAAFDTEPHSRRDD